MATEFLPHIKSGVIAGDTQYFRSDAANTLLWAPVILMAAASGYYLPEVATTATLNDPKVIGVSVGGTGMDLSAGYCNVTEGDMVSVCILGVCKVKVDGSGVNIADGDALVSKGTAGYALKGTITLPTTYSASTVETQIKILTAVFAQALEASAAAGDIIPCFVRGAMGTVA